MMNNDWNHAYCIGQIQVIVRQHSHYTAEQMVDQVRQALAELEAKQETQK